MLSKAVGRPVRVQGMRYEGHAGRLIGPPLKSRRAFDMPAFRRQCRSEAFQLRRIGDLIIGEGMPYEGGNHV